MQYGAVSKSPREALSPRERDESTGVVLRSADANAIDVTLGGEDRTLVVVRSQRCAVLPGPPHVKNIIGAELCERFCYYGLRSLLVLYLTNALDLSESAAVSVMAYWTAVTYTTPLVCLTNRLCVVVVPC